MSVKVMGIVWDAELERDLKYILLAYADHADHDGTRIYPSVGLIAWKTGYSERQVQRYTKELVRRKILVFKGDSYLGTRLYSINMDALSERSAYDPKGVKGKRGRPKKNGDTGDTVLEKNGDIQTKNGDIQGLNGDIAMSPEPSFNPSINPSITNSGASAAAGTEPEDLITGPNAEYRRGLRDTMKKGAEAQAKKVEAGLPILDGLEKYPTNIHPFLERFCDLSKIPLPPAQANEGKDWIMSAEVIVSMPGFTLEVLNAIFQAKQAGELKYSIYRPGSIIKEARRMIGELKQDEDELPGGWTREGMEAMRQRIRAEKAKRAAAVV